MRPLPSIAQSGERWIGLSVKILFVGAWKTPAKENHIQFNKHMRF